MTTINGVDVRRISTLDDLDNLVVENRTTADRCDHHAARLLERARTAACYDDGVHDRELAANLNWMAIEMRAGRI